MYEAHLYCTVHESHRLKTTQVEHIPFFFHLNPCLVVRRLVHSCVVRYSARVVHDQKLFQCEFYVPKYQRQQQIPSL